MGLPDRRSGTIDRRKNEPDYRQDKTNRRTGTDRRAGSHGWYTTKTEWFNRSQIALTLGDAHSRIHLDHADRILDAIKKSGGVLTDILSKEQGDEYNSTRNRVIFHVIKPATDGSKPEHIFFATQAAKENARELLDAVKKINHTGRVEEL